MINLSRKSAVDNISLPEIAREENISLKYLERLFSKLKKSGLVISEKGMSGGYKLAKNSKDINVFEIITALEGALSPFHCVDEKGKIKCSSKCSCGATSVLLKVQQAVNSTLKKTKLSDLT